MKILVTGATGNLGTSIIKHLLKNISASNIAVSVRDKSKANDLADMGIDVREANFDKPETLDVAFAGIERLLIISTSDVTLDGDKIRLKQHLNAVEAAKRANVEFIGFTSSPNASESDFFLAQVYKQTEAAIIETGIPYSFLRNNWYLENEVPNIATAMQSDSWLSSTGEGKVGWVLRDELAEAIAKVLSENGHDNTVYELANPLMTYRELVAILGEVLNKNITFTDVDDVAYGDIMKQAGVPESYIPMLVNINKGIRNGGLAVESEDLEKVLGRKPMTIKESLALLVKDMQS